jgi:two-component system, cell cycle sensor histidine kinase and response regulator CckA
MSPAKGRPREPRPAQPATDAGAAELRATVERLRASLDSYRVLLDEAADGIGISDREGRILHVNASGCRMMGRTLEEMVAMRAHELFAPGETEAQPLAIEEALRGETVYRERKMRCKDGRILEVETSTRGLPDGRVITVVRDLTPRRRAEERLAESKARYKAVVERATVGITITDAQWRFVEVNPRACEIFGYSREELLRLTVRDVAAPGELENAPLREPELKGGRDSFSTRRVRRPDGTERIVDISARDLGDGQVVSVVTDVTDRVEAARLLVESERNLGRAQELARFGTWEAELDSRTLRWSPEMYRIFDVSPDVDPVTFEQAMACLHPEDRAEVERLTNDVLKSRSTPRTHEYRLQRADGSIRIVEATVESKQDAGGKVVRLLGSVQDITEHRLLEAQLREAQKLEAIGRLAGGVAHDFNNLLTVILGFAETMLDGMAPEDRHHDSAEQIRLAARRAARLTQQLLAFGRRQMFRLEVFDLNDVLGEMKDILRQFIGEQIEISICPGARRASIRADRGQIEQVVLNLALNARDAMPSGGRLDIATANVDPPAGWGTPRSAPCLLLTVSDTGMGMGPEVRAHIFEPFYTTKDVGQGTGLGLATVHGIVSQSGGRIEVSSAPGRGASFRVYLPCAEVAAVPAEADAAAPQGGGDETVLLVEDDEAVRVLVGEVMRRRGYHVLEAAGGEEAVEMAGRHAGPLHLLITDIVMPGMTGQDLTRRLLEVRPGLRALLISGYSGERVDVGALAAPSVAFLQKPFSPGLLAQRVRELLDAPAEGPART